MRDLLATLRRYGYVFSQPMDLLRTVMGYSPFPLVSELNSFISIKEVHSFLNSQTESQLRTFILK